SIGCLVNATIIVIVPQVTGGTRIHDVVVLRINQYFGNVLGVLKPDVVPVFAAIGRLVDAIADRNAISQPTLPGTHPDNLRVRVVDGDRTNRLHILTIEYRLEGCAAVHGLPDAAARGARKYGHPSIFFQ